MCNGEYPLSNFVKVLLREHPLSHFVTALPKGEPRGELTFKLSVYLASPFGRGGRPKGLTERALTTYYLLLAERRGRRSLLHREAMPLGPRPSLPLIFHVLAESVHILDLKHLAAVKGNCTVPHAVNLMGVHTQNTNVHIGMMVKGGCH